MRRQVILSLLAVGFMLGVTTRGPAQEPPGATFTTIDVPEAIYTEAVDVNADGEIVGRYYDEFGRPSCRIPCFILDGHNHGFLLSRSGFTTIDVPFPDSRLTAAIGINPQGDLVGRYVTCQQGPECRVADSISHGFLRRGDTFTSIDFPGATSTIATGINPRGDIVGAFDDARGHHAFLLKHDRELVSFDFPGVVLRTEAWKINPAGDIVGQYESIDGKSHVFLRSSEGEFTSIDFPGPVLTAPRPMTIVGINARGDIVSSYCKAAPCFPLLIAGNVHGFLLSKGEFTSIDVPEAEVTVAWGINARGDIVGAYAFSVTTCCNISIKGHGYLLSSGK